jgi:hypothetical protein
MLKPLRGFFFGWRVPAPAVRRPAADGAHTAANTKSPHGTVNTMSEYKQAPRCGKAEMHNGEKPREEASRMANDEEAVRPADSCRLSNRHQ